MQARTEAEHMRLEVRRLETSLDRKEVQLVELQVRGLHTGSQATSVNRLGTLPCCTMVKGSPWRLHVTDRRGCNSRDTCPRGPGRCLGTQAAYDDVLERLKGQSNELLAALGGSPGSVTLGAADETALSQVRLARQPFRL